MTSTRGHHLVVNEYVAEGLRQTQEQDAGRDDARRPVHGPGGAVARAPDDPASPALQPVQPVRGGRARAGGEHQPGLRTPGCAERCTQARWRRRTAAPTDCTTRRETDVSV